MSLFRCLQAAPMVRATALWRCRWIWFLWLLVFPLWSAPNSVEESSLTAGLRDPGHGRELSLEAGGRRFIAILDEALTPVASGLAILLPEAGLRADAGLMRALRRVLPVHGWSTLGLQLPVLEAEARPQEYLSLLPDATSRIGAAVAQMKQGGVENMALVGHGFGALAALRYLAEGADASVRALVLVSPWWPEDREGELRGWLGEVNVPVLDVHGERDARWILKTAIQRHLILKGRPGYRQWRISGAGHHYHGREPMLATRVYGWLRTVAPGKEASQ